KKNASWADIATAMITAEGQCRPDDEGKNGAAYFLASHRGADAVNERAAETSRVFLGSQVQCAQCHDHPSDPWKRVQFHEFGAYVNRVWGVLMGQSFYEPVDDMGPQKQAVFPGVLTRLTASFRYSNSNVKGLFRDVMNSQAYQRQIRLGESADEHLHFAAAYPTRLPADALWRSLVGVLGQLGGPPAGARAAQRPLAPRAGLQGLFELEFGFDPSLKPDEVEGSVSQALLMMNNPAINNRIQATGKNLLARVLSSHDRDDDALRTLYLRTLARKPTDRELERCLKYVRSAGGRREAF